jgi:predicted DNA binding CopG/RHH family protein
MKRKLNAEEQILEDDMEKLQPVNAAKRQLIEGIIDKANEKRSISLRLKSNDVELLKRRAEAEGLSWQTLLSSIVHKFLSDQLIDRRSILKSMEILRDSDFMLPE